MTATETERLRQEYLLPYQGSTHQGYARSLDLWFEWCTSQHLNPLEVGRADVDRYARPLTARGSMPAAVRYRLAPVRGYYRYVLLEGVLARDPTALARLPQVNESPNTAR